MAAAPDRVEGGVVEGVAEFLLRFPPFEFLEPADLRALAARVSVRQVPAGTVLFRQGTQPADEFYMVRQGTVSTYLEGPPRLLVDVCDEGDLFGVRPLIAREAYLATAEAKEDSVLYVIPVAAAEPHLRSNPKVALYFAAGFASGRPQQRRRLPGSGEAARPARPRTDPLPLLNDTVILDATKTVLTCPPVTPIRAAAVEMTARGFGSIVVADGPGTPPLGIITDRDLRSQVVTGRFGADEPVTAIMSSPVKTVQPGITVAEAMIQMMKQKVHHLCVTRDGTPGTGVVGMVSDHDLLLVQGFNPAVMIKEVHRTSSVDQMARIRLRAEELMEKHLEQGVRISHVAGMMGAITDAIVQRLVELHLERAGAPPRDFAWLSLGSQGREEQLLRTDQDHALLYAGEADPGARAWFLGLAESVSSGLEACGFQADPAGISATNPEWCLSLADWKGTFRRWVRQPDERSILLSTIFFDYRANAGAVELALDLSRYLYDELSKASFFLPFLTKSALSTPPPLSFFRNFVVESNGDHKDQFDLKLRAMLPLVDTARILTLSHAVVGENNTCKRYRKLAELEPTNRELFEEAAVAYEILLGIRARFGLRNRNSGRYIDPDELNKIERQTLRTIFAAVKELQDLLSVRFQSDFIR